MPFEGDLLILFATKTGLFRPDDAPLPFFRDEAISYTMAIVMAIHRTITSTTIAFAGVHRAKDLIEDQQPPIRSSLPESPTDDLLLMVDVLVLLPNLDELNLSMVKLKC